MNRQGDLRTGIDCAAAWKLSTITPARKFRILSTY